MLKLPLDEYTNYHFDHEDRLVLNMKGIRESKNSDENILEYTKEDLERYFFKMI